MHISYIQDTHTKQLTHTIISEQVCNSQTPALHSVLLHNFYAFINEKSRYSMFRLFFIFHKKLIPNYNNNEIIFYY